jgi:hypothetical protein
MLRSYEIREDGFIVIRATFTHFYRSNNRFARRSLAKALDAMVGKSVLYRDIEALARTFNLQPAGHC